MKFQKHIDFLLNNACTSIKFLVHRDFLHTPLTKPFMQKMRAEILEQENIKKHLACQHPDGWFGDELHGGEYGMERSIGTLLNAGIEKEHPAIQKGINALITPEIASQPPVFPGYRFGHSERKGRHRPRCSARCP
mgnify:CR=1 FL=1